MSRLPVAAAWAVALIALLATLGEGGASALGGTVVHGAVALAVAAALALGVEGERTRVPRGMRGAFLAFTACAVAGAAIAPNFFSAWLVLVEIATFAGVVWMASRGPDGLLAILPGVLATGAAVHGLHALVQRLAQGAERPPSTFLNVNHLAAWLVAALLVSGAHAVADSRRRVWIAAALVPAAAALMMSGSRGALVGLSAGIVVLVAVSWRVLDRKARVAVVAASAFVALAAGAGIAWRFRTPDPFPYQRAGIGKAALRLAVERPWTGSGPGQFAAAAANLNFPVENAPLRFARIFETPHSDWLRAPAEFGWPAAAALAIACVLALGRIEARRRAGELTGAAAGAAAALAALATQGLVDDLTSRPALFVLAGSLSGALLAQRRTDGARRWPNEARAAAVLLVLVAFVVGDLAPYLALRAGDPRRNPLSPALWARRADEIAAKGEGFDLPRYMRAREAAERAVRLDPSNARWLVTLAQVEGLGVRNLFRDVAGRERTARLYARAEERAKTNALIPLEAALFLRGSGDPEGARRAAERALRLEPSSIAPRLVLAASLLDTGARTAPSRALALVDEAEALAARFAAVPKVSAYERRLLALDPRDAAAIRERASRGADR